MGRMMAVALSFSIGATSLLGCGGDTVVDNGEAVVTISGDVYVLVGGTLPLAAVTTNATDSAYTWTSSDDLVGTVGADGTFTAVAAGTVNITATGADSAAVGTHGIYIDDPVVVDPLAVPNRTAWEGSGHADATAEAFTHWDADMPAEVPTSCARCHSTGGFRDYMGADGTAFESVEAAAPVGTVIECIACHNEATAVLDTVLFPSGVRLDGLGGEARCMTCHQGRESTVSVDTHITDAAVADDDTVSTMLGFRNVHYFAAGATLNGGNVQGGYQYAGNVYDARFRHVETLDTCTSCHDSHSLAVDFATCATCHTGVASGADARNIRMMASMATDYDGDGDLTEGIDAELVGLRDMLLTAIQAYGTGVNSSAICYAAASYPYWFIDTDGDGSCSATEADRANAYASWTARLVRATYNFQFASKDVGAFAHNAKYVMQLLYDSIADLNMATGITPVDLTTARRNDPGHFNGAGESARHWDGDPAVSASCAKCHSGSDGFQFYLTNGTNIAVPEVGNGMQCETCHSTLADAVAPAVAWSTHTVDSVTFPGDLTITDMGNVDNICMTCHSGRESAATIDASIAAGSFRFRNVHYLPAAGVLLGTAANLGYQYPARTYSGAWSHPGGNGCTGCHDPVATQHTFHPSDDTSCGSGGCHAAAGGIANVRQRAIHMVDFDGDANTTETLGAEIEGMAAVLMTAIQTYATAAMTPICYDAAHYPYFFQDTDGNGTCSATEAAYANQFAGWDAALMKAAHNYQISQKEHGAWAHNFDYMAQILYDSAEDLAGAPPATLTRPAP